MEDKKSHTPHNDSLSDTGFISDLSEDEIDLADILAIFWRHRVLMAIIVCLMVAAGIIYCLLATPLYEISAQIRPGITGYTDTNQEKHSITPEAIKFWFNKKGYLSFIKETVPSKIKDISSFKINAFTKKDSQIVNLSLYWPDANNGCKLLQGCMDIFSSVLSKSLKKEIEITRKLLQQKISDLELEIQQTKNEGLDVEGQINEQKNKIALVKAKLKTLQKNKNEMLKTRNRLEGQIKNVYKNTNELIELRKEMIKENKKVGVDKFALLMYSNIVQQNISYITNLEERLANIEKEINQFDVDETHLKSKINNIETKIQQLETRLKEELPLKIKALEKQKDVIASKIASTQPIDVVQVPFSSPGPVKPKKGLILTLSFVLGCFIAILGAGFREFWLHARSKIS